MLPVGCTVTEIFAFAKRHLAKAIQPRRYLVSPCVYLLVYKGKLTCNSIQVRIKQFNSVQNIHTLHSKRCVKMQNGAKSFPQSHDHPLLKISRIYVHNTNTKGQTAGSCGL